MFKKNIFLKKFPLEKNFRIFRENSGSGCPISHGKTLRQGQEGLAKQDKYEKSPLPNTKPETEDKICIF